MSFQQRIQFVQWQDLYLKEKAFQIFFDIPADAQDQRKTNLVFKDVEVPIEDIRGHEKDYELDVHGFTVRQLPPLAGDFSPAAIESSYIPQIEALLKSSVVGADHVVIFDWRIRQSECHAAEAINIQDRSVRFKPSNYAHLDTGPMSALERAQKHMSVEEGSIRSVRRVRIVNVWRPLCHAVFDWPLALCDGRTVDPADFVETDAVRKGDIGTTLFMMHRPQHRWLYLSRQSETEALMFKQFDSDWSVSGKYCPHAAFKIEGQEQVGPPRTSIEVRSLILTCGGEDTAMNENLHESV